MLKGTEFVRPRIIVATLLALIGMQFVTPSAFAAKSGKVNCGASPHPHVDLAGCNLSGRNLNHVNLFGADLQGANLNGVELIHANLSFADLTRVNLSLADLSGTRLQGANLSGVSSGSIIGKPELPLNWKLISGYLVGPRANLNDANFSASNLAHTDLFDVQLGHATLTAVSSGSVRGNPILPTNWKIVDGYLIGPRANLTKAKLRGANLSLVDATGANLSRANLTSANLPGANLSNSVLTGARLSRARMNGATLDGVTSGLVVGRPVLPTGWLLVNGFLVGQGAILTDANLANANLFDANLTGADLSGAILTGVSSGGVQGQSTVKLPNSWSMLNGYLVGPGANLSRANLAGSNIGYFGDDLQGVNLAGANLSGISWNGSNLIDANLSGANMSSANIALSQMTDINLSGANLTGASFSESNMSTAITSTTTICPNGTAGPCSGL